MFSRRGLMQKALDWALLAVTLVSLAMAFWRQAPEWLGFTVLLTFVILFFVRWYIDDDGHAYLRANWLDLVLVVLLSSPFLRLLVAFKVAGLAPVLRLSAFFRKNKRHFLNMLVLSGESLPAAMALVFSVVFFFGAAEYLLERGVNPAFSNISDGLWWAFVTLTTVGYGDVVPATTAGRLLAVMTMIFGIALYSLLIANLTYFVEGLGVVRVRESEQYAARKKKLTAHVADPKVRRPRKLRLKKVKA